jgi:Lipocalin-like domain
MKPFIYTLFLLVIFTQNACDKTSTDPSGRLKILESGDWQFTASFTSVKVGDSTEIVDLLATLPECTKDNYFIFQPDGTLIVDEGATKCNDSNPQRISSGTWQLMNNSTQLQFTDEVFGFGIVTANLNQIDNSILQISYVTTYNGDSAITTTAYSHHY